MKYALMLAIKSVVMVFTWKCEETLLNVLINVIDHGSSKDGLDPTS